MSQKYIFSDDYLGVSNNKIHILRNRFEVESLGFDELQSVELKRGQAINNWVVLLIVGSALLIGALKLSQNLFYFIIYGSGTIYIEHIVGAFFLVIFGMFAIYKSLKKELILEVKAKKKKYKFSMREFKNDEEFEGLINYLDDKIKVFNPKMNNV